MVAIDEVGLVALLPRGVRVEDAAQPLRHAGRAVIVGMDVADERRHQVRRQGPVAQRRGGLGGVTPALGALVELPAEFRLGEERAPGLSRPCPPPRPPPGWRARPRRTKPSRRLRGRTGPRPGRRSERTAHVPRPLRPHQRGQAREVPGRQRTKRQPVGGERRGIMPPPAAGGGRRGRACPPSDCGASGSWTRAEPLGQRDRAGVAGRDVADDAVPAEVR